MDDLPVTDHRALPVMTIECAHRIMRRHLDCPVTICPVKRQAKIRLIEAGRLIPSDRPNIGF